jgi:hypothetical protein
MFSPLLIAALAIVAVALIAWKTGLFEKLFGTKDKEFDEDQEIAEEDDEYEVWGNYGSGSDPSIAAKIENDAWATDGYSFIPPSVSPPSSTSKCNCNCGK